MSAPNTKAEAREALKKLKAEAKAAKKQLKTEKKLQKQEEKQKYPTAALRRKARRLRWKQQRFEKRRNLRASYEDAPWPLRVARLYLVKPLIAVVIIAALGAAAYAALPQALMTFNNVNKDKPVAKEKIYALSPIDKEGAKRIDAAKPVDKDDTWTICVYMIGSNLEDMGENDLSSAVAYQAQDMRQELEEADAAARKTRFKGFSSELGENKLDLPAYLYYPEKPVVSEDYGESSGPVIADMPGFASTDIGEMTAETWSDNIHIVIQPGGALRWSNDMINPNRTQRFEYYKGDFREVYDEPLQSASDPKTLTSFLKFCKEEYPADHTMLVLWNHGGGAFGYGHDSIYNHMMSLKDIRTALEGAYEPNKKDPAFDIIGFDACLMSSVEVAHAMDGFASYYAVSEELEPGDGWDYTSWLKAMTKDPTLSPAKVARKIADAYMNHYMTQNVNMGWLITNNVTFSVLDGKKTEMLYDAWCDLNKQMLIDATEDNSVLSEIGRCGNKSTHYAAEIYNVYNTIDMGNYVDQIVDTYPEEASSVKNLIKDCVLYHRESGILSDSQGISAYVPAAINNYSGLMMCLEYIYNICDDPATRALYYYKIAGCLNEDMQKYVETIADEKLVHIDLELFKQFAKATPKATDTGFEIPVDEKIQSMTQRYEVEAAAYDEETGVVRNYGKDELARLDGEGNLDCEFDGTWICLDGVPLATEVVSSRSSGVEYRSKVIHNGKESTLTFSWDRDTEEYTINGIRREEGSAGGLANEDPINYLSNTRTVVELQRGDTIVPVYETSGEDLDSDSEERGETITIRKRSKITDEKLPAGYYLTAAVISDFRGDVYYSQVVGNDVSGGKVKKREVDSDFRGRDY